MTLVVFLLLLISCDNPEDNAVKSESVNDLHLFSWIEGTWLDTNTFRNYNPPGHYIEEWSISNDSIHGVGLKVVGSDTSITRYMSIRKLNNEPVFIERELGQAMISYSYSKLDSSSFAFINKAQSFPREIIYQKNNEDSMSISLKGIVEEFDREIKMRFKKGDS